MAPTSKSRAAVAERPDAVADELHAELAAELKKAQKLTAELEARLAATAAKPAEETAEVGALMFWHRCPATDGKGFENCRAPQFWDAAEPAANLCHVCGENPGPQWVLRMASNHGLDVRPLTGDEIASQASGIPSRPAQSVRKREDARKYQDLRRLANATLEQHVTTPDIG